MIAAIALGVTAWRLHGRHLGAGVGPSAYALGYALAPSVLGLAAGLVVRLFRDTRLPIWMFGTAAFYFTLTLIAHYGER